MTIRRPCRQKNSRFSRTLVDEAVQQLSKSRKGINAMRHLLVWLDDDGLALDHNNQEAVETLLAAAWYGGLAGTVLHSLRQATEKAHEKHSQ